MFYLHRCSFFSPKLRTEPQAFTLSCISSPFHFYFKIGSHLGSSCLSPLECWDCSCAPSHLVLADCYCPWFELPCCELPHRQMRQELRGLQLTGLRNWVSPLGKPQRTESSHSPRACRADLAWLHILVSSCGDCPPRGSECGAWCRQPGFLTTGPREDRRVLFLVTNIVVVC